GSSTLPGRLHPDPCGSCRWPTLASPVMRSYSLNVWRLRGTSLQNLLYHTGKAPGLSINTVLSRVSFPTFPRLTDTTGGEKGPDACAIPARNLISETDNVSLWSLQ